MTKIDIISGFLGAGKTTLIKKLIKEAFAGEKVVLIENEFGEIGIDGGFLKDAGIEITEMNSGCICCSLVGDFGTALKDVLVKFTPDRIIIEPSGVGKLSDVIKAVQDVQAEVKGVELNSFVTVADVKKIKMYMKNFGEFYNNQIEHASTVILSRTQDVKDEKLEAAVKMIQEHNKEASVITTPWEALTGEQILSAMEKEQSLVKEILSEEEVCPVCGHHHEEHGHHEHHHHEGHSHEEQQHHHDHEEHSHEEHHHHEHDEHCGCGHDHGHEGHHHADDVFTSWGVETPHKYEEADVKAILETLSDSEQYGTILRAKGMLPNVNGEWIYFDLVPGEFEIRTGTPDYTGRICVIGAKLHTEEIEKLFHLN